MKSKFLLAATFIILTLTSCYNNSSTNLEQEKIIDSQLLNYSILREELTDIPSKRLVKWEILIPQKEINEAKIKELLNALYTKANLKSNFKSGSGPNMIYIYAYTSKEKAESGMGQWVAMLSKTIHDDIPKISISDVQLNSTKIVPMEKFGLTEGKRQNIWTDMIKAEDRARKEAGKRYTTITTDDNYKQENLEKNMELNTKLYKKYMKEVAKAYGIKPQILDSISNEGLAKGWPFPN